MIDARVVSVHLGRAAPLGPKPVLGAFVKHAVEGSVMVGPLGLDGDEQAGLTVHGGPDKAVYGYAASHYAAWAAECPALASKFVPGSVGENLALEGMNELDICVGDVHAIGEALLQVCQPRQPCFKFALRFNNNAARDGAQRSIRLVLSCASTRPDRGG
jgi:MOSC domain-containing protein YiiM